MEMTSLYLGKKNSDVIIKGCKLRLGKLCISRPCLNHAFLTIASPHSLASFPQLPLFVQPDSEAFRFHYHF